MTSAAASLAMLERRQAVLANNLANASTHGFKQVDLTPGTLAPSGNPLDLALEGDGFFVVKTPAGERHVRGGSFHLDSERRVVDHAGNPLLTESGELTLPPGALSQLEVSAAGDVKLAGKAVGRLRIESIAANANPQHEGGVRFIPDASRQPIAPEARRVAQGALEESNVNPMDAMTSMLDVLHRFGAAQKTIAALDSVRGIAVTDLGKPV
ncbi:MAG: flagellar hook basal-body protein [Gemmatimonadaceae bacterium]|nr:flagellar hook basal-body protein [Gemmatimonadaceae bacterium]